MKTCNSDLKISIGLIIQIIFQCLDDFIHSIFKNQFLIHACFFFFLLISLKRIGIREEIFYKMLKTVIFSSYYTTRSFLKQNFKNLLNKILGFFFLLLFFETMACCRIFSFLVSYVSKHLFPHHLPNAKHLPFSKHSVSITFETRSPLVMLTLHFTYMSRTSIDGSFEKGIKMNNPLELAQLFYTVFLHIMFWTGQWQLFGISPHSS